MAGSGASGLALLSTSRRGRAADGFAITIRDQTTTGRKIVIDELSTTARVRYTVATPGHERTFSRGQFSAGIDTTDLTVALDGQIIESQRIEVTLYPAGGGEAIEKSTADVTVENVDRTGEIPVMRIDADPEAGFNYPYFLWAPSVPVAETGKPILVSPNNTGTPTDDFSQHEARARESIERGLSRDVSSRLGTAMVVPVFPRPQESPVDWRHYTHSLDRETLAIEEGPLERIDRQLLRMVEDAQERLADRSYAVADDIVMNGFSAAGNFVDRFTVIHPDRVRSVSAGGLNGMALLPLSEADGKGLSYHVGIDDLESLTGSAVDLEALDEVNQFLYMGGEDSNDTIPYEDAWTSDELRNLAVEIYGEDMIVDRFPRSQAAYEEAGVDAQFKVYSGVGHNPRPALNDIVRFHRRSIEGESVDSFGQSLGLTARVSASTRSPVTGQTVTFDASDSTGRRETIRSLGWEFDDGETALGERVEHSFETAGDHTVTVTAIDSAGREDSASVTVTVETGTPPEPTASATPGPMIGPATETQTTSSTAPGFGVGSTVGSVIGLGLVKRYLGSSEGESDE